MFQTGQNRLFGKLLVIYCALMGSLLLILIVLRGLQFLVLWTQC